MGFEEAEKLRKAETSMTETSRGREREMEKGNRQWEKKKENVKDDGKK